VYARNGYFLGAIAAPTHRQPVAYDAMSPWIRKATVAAEDRTFWTNDGFDYTSIARAVLADVAAGGTVQGASTISQQLVRNLYLTDDKTFGRKRLEACLELKLTTQETKRGILTEYLNRIPYGGMHSGSRRRRIPTSAFRPRGCGPPRRHCSPACPRRRPPTTRSSTRAPRSRAGTRCCTRCAPTGRSPDPTTAGSSAGLLELHPGRRYWAVRMPNFFAYVDSKRVAAYGRSAVENGGLRVYTTLDPRAQTIALNAMRNALGRRGDPAAALVCIDPHSGGIRALASSWHGHELQFDLPADAARQTGSAFKTFVLTDAVWFHRADPNRTWYDSSKFTYQPTAQSKPWTPRTYEGRYFEPETLTKAACSPTTSSTRSSRSTSVRRAWLTSRTSWGSCRRFGSSRRSDWARTR
jgi:membrane peptidoglycan carboxypeptidase